MQRGLVQGQRLYDRKMDVLTPQGTKAGHWVCQSLGVLLGSTGVTSLGQRCHLQVGRASRFVVEPRFNHYYNTCDDCPSRQPAVGSLASIHTSLYNC